MRQNLLTMYSHAKACVKREPRMIKQTEKFSWPPKWQNTRHHLMLVSVGSKKQNTKKIEFMSKRKAAAPPRNPINRCNGNLRPKCKLRLLRWRHTSMSKLKYVPHSNQTDIEKCYTYILFVHEVKHSNSNAIHIMSSICNSHSSQQVSTTVLQWCSVAFPRKVNRDI